MHRTQGYVMGLYLCIHKPLGPRPSKRIWVFFFHILRGRDVGSSIMHAPDRIFMNYACGKIYIARAAVGRPSECIRGAFSRRPLQNPFPTHSQHNVSGKIWAWGFLEKSIDKRISRGFNFCYLSKPSHDGLDAWDEFMHFNQHNNLKKKCLRGVRREKVFILGDDFWFY